MRKLILTVIFTVFTLILFAQVKVKGYYRKDGTYVQPHYRSNPDGNPYNNWSYPGNVNPYTGKVAGGSEDTYLRNYNDGKFRSTNKIFNDFEPTPVNYEIERALNKIKHDNAYTTNSNFTYTSNFNSKEKQVKAKKLNLRSYPSTNSSVIKQLYFGEQVEVQNYLSGGWVYVKITVYDFNTGFNKSLYGYVSSQFLF
jgi:hypothetical protein